MRGRDPKLTPERSQALIDSLARGEPINVACGYAGISKTTLYKWLDRGEAETETETDIDPDDYTLRQLRTMAERRQVDTKGARSKAQLAERINAAPSEFVEFVDRYKKTLASAESYVVSQMVRTGQNDWRFWMTYAERRWPANWGRRQRLEEEIDDYQTIGAGTADDAQTMIEFAKEIRVKMLGTGTDG